jgi:hypothetical protein
MSENFLNDSNDEQIDHKKRYARWEALGERQIDLLREYYHKGYKTGLDLGQWIEKKTGIPVEDQPPDSFR